MNIVHHATPREHGAVFWFVRHPVAMTVAMIVGMAAYAVLLGALVALAGNPGDGRRDALPAGRASSRDVRTESL